MPPASRFPALDDRPNGSIMPPPRTPTSSSPSCPLQCPLTHIIARLLALLDPLSHRPTARHTSARLLTLPARPPLANIASSSPHQNPLFPRQTPKTSRPAPSAHLALRPARAPAHPSPKARPACPRSCSLPHPRPPRAAALHRASGARSETRTPCSRSPTTVRTRA